MSDRSLPARQRPSLAYVYRCLQAVTYALAAVAFSQPAFMSATVDVFRQLIAFILN